MLRRCPSLICSWLIAILSGGLACGGEDRLAVEPTTGTLEVTTSTSGAEPDADGYTLQMDAEPAQAIGANATLQTADVTPGTHSVQLGEIAPNCTVAAENPRTATIVAGETATVEFAVTCEAATGGVQVTSSTSGPVPGPDGYSLMLDGADRGTLGTSSTVTLNGVTPGTHQVGLSGVAANCQVEGANPQSVFVIVGASAAVAFTITCVEPPASAGTLTVATSMSGRNLDPDGYLFAIDGGLAQPIPANGIVDVANLAAGIHSVHLSGLAANCALRGDNPRSVEIIAGTTASLSFVTICSATSQVLLLPQHVHQS